MLSKHDLYPKVGGKIKPTLGKHSSLEIRYLFCDNLDFQALMKF